MNLEITEEDIKNGKPGRGQECPVKIAMDRQYPDLKVWHVNAYSMTHEARPHNFRLRTSYKLQNFIINFDRGYTVNPGIYQIYEIEADP